MVKFNKCRLTPEILDQWVSTSVNVLLIGEKGVGKSYQVKDTFDRNKLKYAYFSGATLDPWIHLLGIPKAKMMPDGKEKMEFILPENLDDDVEAIFVDEWNRTNKVVRNALLELQQFKSINGRKFPKLQMIWGAVNPPKDKDDDDGSDYDVDELDPAQLDRFHVIVELPNEPNQNYFKKKFGMYKGKVLVDWWEKQPKEALKILSPRRLDYVGECFEKGLDIKYLLPVAANVVDLIKALSLDEKEEMVNNLLMAPTDAGMRIFMADEQNILKYRSRLKNPVYWGYWEYANKEFVLEEMKTNQAFEEFAVYQILLKNKFYTSAILEIAKSNPKNVSVKIVKQLLAEKYKPEDITLSGFISDEPNFITLEHGSAVQKQDVFSAWHNSWQSITLPQHYSPLQAIYQLNTQDRRKSLDNFLLCWETVKKPHHAINFMMSCLFSMQEGTIKSTKKFLPIFGTICMMAKKHLSATDLALMVKDVIANSDKLSVNRIEDFTNYLIHATSSPMPDSFLKKVRDVRAVVSIANGEQSLVDLLQM